MSPSHFLGYERPKPSRRPLWVVGLLLGGALLVALLVWVFRWVLYFNWIGEGMEKVAR